MAGSAAIRFAVRACWQLVPALEDAVLQAMSPAAAITGEGPSAPVEAGGVVAVVVEPGGIVAVVVESGGVVVAPVGVDVAVDVPGVVTVAVDAVGVVSASV